MPFTVSAAAAAVIVLVSLCVPPPPDLSRNRLAKVTNNAFVNLSNLTYLDLSYNKLVKLESASVEPLKKLHTLNISGNIQMDLYDIREAFQVISLYISSLLTLPLLLFFFVFFIVVCAGVFGSFNTPHRIQYAAMRFVAM